MSAQRIDSRWSRLRLRTRISLLVAIAVGLAVALTSVAAFLTVRHTLYQQLDETLTLRARNTVNSPLIDPQTLQSIPQAALGPASDVRIAIVTNEDPPRRFALGELPPIGEPEFAVARGESPHSLRSAQSDGTTFRVVALPIPGGVVVAGDQIIASGIALILAQSTAPTETALARLGVVLLVVGGIGIVVAAAAGVSVARSGLRPVGRLTAAAEHIAATDELQPIKVEGHDELARLAESFNAMLAALSQSRARQRQLVVDAGHELRTPLTSLRTNLDLLAQSLRGDTSGLDPAERDALLDDVRAQIEEMSGLVSDLVELTRGDQGVQPYERVEMTEVVERALERVRRRAPGVEFAARLRPWELSGDSAALERAVMNLLDNAAKWSPADGMVAVESGDGVVRVTDQGPGIPAADLPHVFERFYRAPEARTLPGSGLGLAIVRQVVTGHGGHVRAENAPSGGARFTVWLPETSSSQSLSHDSGSSQDHQRQ